MPLLFLAVWYFAYRRLGGGHRGLVARAEGAADRDDDTRELMSTTPDSAQDDGERAFEGSHHDSGEDEAET